MARKLTLLTLTATLIIGFAFLAEAQTSPDDAEKRYRELLERMQAGPSPDTDSEDWKPLTEDVGLMVYTDRFGTRRATLHVRIDGLWTRVALDSIQDLGPRAMPTR